MGSLDEVFLLFLLDDAPLSDFGQLRFRVLEGFRGFGFILADRSVEEAGPVAVIPRGRFEGCIVGCLRIIYSLDTSCGAMK